MKYKILEGYSAIELQVKVESYIKDNWKLHGDLHVIVKPTYDASKPKVVFYQVVIKL